MTLQVPLALEQLARLIAVKTGKTPDDIVREAIESRTLATGVAVTRPRRCSEDIERRIKEIAERVAALPILDHRSDDDIIGFDEFGVPR